MNILIDNLPEHIMIDDTPYPVNTDFRVWIKFALMFEDTKQDRYQFITKVLNLCLKKGNGQKLPALDKLLDAVYEFYAMKQPKPTQGRKQDENKKAVFSFEYDAEYIYTAFYSQYGIDLNTANMHWWKFKTLFQGLTGEHQYCKIIEYRTIKLSEIKDKKQREQISKMKRLYALPDNRTEEQKERDFQASFIDAFI